MRPPRHFLSLVSWLALVLGPESSIHSADAAARSPTGEITGQVQNAVTGEYLSKVRMTVKGTNRVAFTDEFGTYRLPDVSSGAVVLESFYTGLDAQEITVQVPAGATVRQDISLTNLARYGRSGETLKLDPYVVTTAKLTEGQALSINEQRFAPNIKNVVSTNAYGDVTEGNIGEFVKYLPGVDVQYSGPTAQSAIILGFPTEYAIVTVDGVEQSNANGTGLTRQYWFQYGSINNTSRIELTKVPTPATRADTLAGSLNLVGKSAFERTNAQFNYQLMLQGNSESLTLKRTPSPPDKSVYKINPGFNFDYTLPVNKNLGFVLTGSSSNQWTNYIRKNTTYNTSVGGASAPFIQQYSVQDLPSLQQRNTVTLRTDWRPTANSVLSLGLNASYYQTFNTNDQWTVSAGTVATPTAAGGIGLTYGPNFTNGATGRGTMTMGGNYFHVTQVSNGANARYRLDQGGWHFDAIAAASRSRLWQRGMGDGDNANFGSLTISSFNPIRVVLNNVVAGQPGSIQVFDNNNLPVNYDDIRQYRLTGAAVTSWGDVRNNNASGELNVRRDVDWFGTTASIQAGGAQRTQLRDRAFMTDNFTYQAPDADATPARYLSPYANYKSYLGVGPLPWPSPIKGYKAWQANPSLFNQTLAQQVANAKSYINGSWRVKEDVSAAYVQASAKFLNNRLWVLGGVRFEQTVDDGVGPLSTPNAVYVLNADGTFAHDAKGALIRKPEAGAAGSLQELPFISHYRGTHGHRSYNGYYPSLHLTYTLQDNLLLRFGYAKTYGRPDFSSTVPTTTITPATAAGAGADTGTGGGTISVANVGLKPWTANNYDLTLEYYTKQGGILGAEVFLKDVTNFFGAVTKTATAADLQQLGLESQYEGWTLTTTYNSGNARVTGGVLNAQQSLQGLGPWGKYFSVFGNVTKVVLQGENSPDFTGYTPFMANWGGTFSKAPVTVTARWNHRGNGYVANTGNYLIAATTLDLTLNYQLSKRLALFAVGRNILKAPHTLMTAVTAATPGYAKVVRDDDYGIQFSCGIKGTF